MEFMIIIFILFSFMGDADSAELNYSEQIATSGETNE